MLPESMLQLVLNMLREFLHCSQSVLPDVRLSIRPPSDRWVGVRLMPASPI